MRAWARPDDDRYFIRPGLNKLVAWRLLESVEPNAGCPARSLAPGGPDHRPNAPGRLGLAVPVESLRPASGRAEGGHQDRFQPPSCGRFLPLSGRFRTRKSAAIVSQLHPVIFAISRVDSPFAGSNCAVERGLAGDRRLQLVGLSAPGARAGQATFAVRFPTPSWRGGGAQR